MHCRSNLSIFSSVNVKDIPFVTCHWQLANLHWHLAFRRLNGEVDHFPSDFTSHREPCLCIKQHYLQVHSRIINITSLSNTTLSK